MVEHVLFLRHAQTQYLVEKRISGRSLEIPILSEIGISIDVAVDCVFCSPALRCRQTLDILQRSNPVGQVFFNQKLLERGMGVMEGQYRSDMVKQYPHLFHGDRFRLYETPPQGESFEEYHKRPLHLWDEISHTQSGTVLICAHNQILKMLSFVIWGNVPTESEWEERCFPVGVITKIY